MAVARMALRPTKYLFVDGGYLREVYSRFAEAWFEAEDKNNREIDFASLGKFLGPVEKTFYYDCMNDIRKQGETEVQFQERVNKQEESFNKIRSTRGCHVQLGTLAGGKRRQQKEVDILLAVDMMNHSIRQNISHAILLAGDRDFRPVVRSLVELGIFVTVAGDMKIRHLSWLERPMIIVH